MTVSIVIKIPNKFRLCIVLIFQIASGRILKFQTIY
jgi:hypothetical protein